MEFDANKFNAVYREFLTFNKGIDAFKIDKKVLLRSEWKDIMLQSKNEELKSIIKIELTKYKKSVKINNIEPSLENPFKLLNIQTKTPVQDFISRQIPTINIYGAFMYQASCGSGKTLAGIYAMYTLNCKTLIISCRNSINDQWKSCLSKLYPNLKICTITETVKATKKALKTDADVYIFTPQFLISKINTSDLDFLKPSLIIYDEIHSLCSDKFQQVFSLPFLYTITKKYSELPYLIGLTATLPAKNSNDRKMLEHIFGKAFLPESPLKIPVHIWDYRNTIAPSRRGRLDERYSPPDEYDFLDIATTKATEENNYPSVKFQWLIMSYTIDTSVYAAMFMREKYKTSVLLVRACNESSYIFRYNPDLIKPIHRSITLKDVTKNLENYTAEEVEYSSELAEQFSIISSTYQRTKEGFSIPRVTTLISTKFPYSPIARVQQLGRARRQSSDKELNEHIRRAYVCSGKIPTNLGVLMKRYKKSYGVALREGKITYDFAYETIMFKKELLEYDKPKQDDEKFLDLKATGITGFID